PGAEPDYKPGYIALYEHLGVPCVPLALNSGAFWPRRSLMRYRGTIVVEFLDPIPPGLPRKDFRRLIEAQIEAATDQLLVETARTQPAPCLGPEARQRLRKLNI
ncbi:MAG: 1-acyl-sn-glycerol-3-phosphate acyltransferase, partial [Hyphomicrobiaceae bacterium]|nr:1-acyl-sn-glycerol-3-phosphate acyltransferase [Hyphomicrobiaceae bacterium]